MAVDEHQLLIRHAETWAAAKKRQLDASVLAQVLELRDRYEDLRYGSWPGGSAEQLLLRTWPAYGPPPPDVAVLGDTLDTFWGFMRATGRMASGSATPAELRKEAKRCLAKLPAAYADPANHSQGRVFKDFGADIGIDLEGAADVDDLQARLSQVMAAWNALPIAERTRRMPDPSPKSVRGREMTAMAGEMLAGDPDEEWDEEVPELRSGDPAVTAPQVRAAPYVLACLALADWVGEGREVTQAGVLRPAVAREAYRDLGLAEWDIRYDDARWGEERYPDDPAVHAVVVENLANAWRSAGDCLALDRLWTAVVATGLVDVGSRRATRSADRPTENEHWVLLGITLVLSLLDRLDEWHTDPLVGFMLSAHVAGGRYPLAAAYEWWDTRCPPPLRDLESIDWRGRLDAMLFHFADCALWWIEEDHYELTDFGHDFLVVYCAMLEQQMQDAEG